MQLLRSGPEVIGSYCTPLHLVVSCMVAVLSSETISVFQCLLNPARVTLSSVVPCVIVYCSSVLRTIVFGSLVVVC